jgi:hypothetical protein
MPYGINYKRVKKELAFVSSQARKGCSFLCLMYLFGVCFFSILNIVWYLEFGAWSLFWVLRCAPHRRTVAAAGRLI